MLPDGNRKLFDIDYKSFGRGLVMASININSLLPCIDELCIFMSSTKIDISINKTEVGPTIDEREGYLPGFKMIRKDRKLDS